MLKSPIELIEAGHPLIAPIATYLQEDDIESRIRRSPLDGVNIGDLSVKDRHTLLDMMQEHLFEPSVVTLSLCPRLFRMIRRGYLSRDPRRLDVRKRTIDIANIKVSKLVDFPWFDQYAKCIRIAGETGTGKTYEVRNALRLLPRFIVHPKNDEAGWTHFVQITWLYVSMAHDGSLGGLLLSILAAIDETIGTKYAEQPSLTRLSNEKLAVRVGLILRVHAVGVLVIDEIQERNFARGVGELAALFFLRLLNFGIPLVLMGNPFGLAALEHFAQDARRIGSAGSINFKPYDVSDYDWINCIAPRIWEFYVLPRPIEFSDPGGRILFKYSGGIRDYACRISCSAQRLALDLNDNALTENHIEMAYFGDDFTESDRNLIEGFAQRDPMKLQYFKDVRTQYYTNIWEKNEKAPLTLTSTQEKPKSPPLKEEKAESKRNSRNRHTKEVSIAKGLATKRNNDAKKTSEAKNSCDTDDIRNSGLKNFLIRGFDALRKGE